MYYIKDIYDIVEDIHYNSWIPTSLRNMQITIAHIEDKSYNKIVTGKEILDVISDIRPYGMFPGELRSFGNGKIDVLNHLDVDYVLASDINKAANFILRELEVIDKKYLTVFSCEEINGILSTNYDIVDLMIELNKYFPDFDILGNKDFFITDREDESLCFKVTKDDEFVKVITKYILRYR